MARRLASLSTVNRLALVLILAGIGYRFAYLWFIAGFEPFRVESQQVAVSLVTTGEFGNPFAEATGPTAHVGLFTPFLPAIAYSIFGVETFAAELALGLVAIGLTLTSYFLAWRCLGLLGGSDPARLAALAFLIFAPLQLRLELVEGRYWEFLSATCCLLLVLRFVLEHDGRADLDVRKTALIGAASAFVFVLSPPVGLTCVLLIAVFALRSIKISRWPILAGASLGTLLAVTTPWAVRNEQALGAPIWLRSNFGLEFALSNYPGALSPANPQAAYVERFEQLHPYGSPVALEQMQASGGEVPYYKRLGDQTFKWVSTHSNDFARLTAKRVVDYYLPPPWAMNPFADEPHRIPNYMLAFLSALGLIGLVLALRNNVLYWYVAICVSVPALPYMFVQPINRYRYVISSILVFLAFEGVAQLHAKFSQRPSRRELPRPG